MWVLVNRVSGSVLLRLGRDGEDSGTWTLQGGGTGLCAHRDSLVWYAPNLGNSLCRLDPLSGREERFFSGLVTWVRPAGRYLVLGRPGDGLTVLDENDRVVWEAAGLGAEPGVQDHIYVCRQRDGVWRPSCLDIVTGALRWEIQWKDADRNLKLTPLGRWVALWDLGDVALVDRQDGTLVQPLSPPTRRALRRRRQRWLPRRTAGARSKAGAPRLSGGRPLRFDSRVVFEFERGDQRIESWPFVG